MLIVGYWMCKCSGSSTFREKNRELFSREGRFGGEKRRDIASFSLLKVVKDNARLSESLQRLRQLIPDSLQRLRAAKEVSAKYDGKMVTELVITSRKGNRCQVKNQWPDSQIEIMGDDRQRVSVNK